MHLRQDIIKLYRLTKASFPITVGSLEMKALLVDHCTSPEDHIFVEYIDSFASRILRLISRRHINRFPHNKGIAYHVELSALWTIRRAR